MIDRWREAVEGAGGEGIISRKQPKEVVRVKKGWSFGA